MTMPKKNRRKITVSETEYHYTVQSGRAVVQHSNGLGSHLFLLQRGDLTPKLVAQGIMDGVASGWRAGTTADDVLMEHDREAGRYVFVPLNDSQARNARY
jgi:hypothetical protein